MDRRRGLPGAARLPHGRSVRAPERRVRRRSDRDMDGHRQLPRSRLPEPRGRSPTTTRRRTWRANRRPNRPAATGARTSSTTRSRASRSSPSRTIRCRSRTGLVTYDAAGDYAALLSTMGSGSVDISASLPLPLLGHLQCGPADASTPAASASGHRRSDGVFGPARLTRAEHPLRRRRQTGLPVQLRHRLRTELAAASRRWSTQGALLTHFAGTKLIPRRPTSASPATR